MKTYRTEECLPLDTIPDFCLHCGSKFYPVLKVKYQYDSFYGPFIEEGSVFINVEDALEVKNEHELIRQIICYQCNYTLPYSIDNNNQICQNVRQIVLGSGRRVTISERR